MLWHESISEYKLTNLLSSSIFGNVGINHVLCPKIFKMNGESESDSGNFVGLEKIYCADQQGKFNKIALDT